MVKYSYDAYGNCVGSGSNMDLAESNPIRYRGYYYDSETKLYYLNARYYNPQWRRFISPDSTDYLDTETVNGLNLYAYCNNDPVNYADPSGHFVLSSFLIGLGIAAAIGAGIGATAYAVGQVLDYALTGTWEWSWSSLLNNTIGGAIGGIASYCFGFFGNALVSAFAGGFASNAMTMTMENLLGNENHTFSSILNSSIFAGIVSVLSIGVMSKFKVAGLNSGRGSFASVTKQIYTKFYRGQIGKIASKTFGKIFASEAYNSIAQIFFDQVCSQTGINDKILGFN